MANHTGEAVEEQISNEAITIVLSILAAGAVSLNTICLAVIVRSPALREKGSTIYITGLLFAHLLQGLLTIPLYVLKRLNSTESQYYPLLCDTFRLAYIFTFYITCLLILLISIDRFLATQWIFDYKQKMTLYRARVATAIVFVYTVVVSLVPFIDFDILTGSKSEENLKNKEKCHYNPPKIWTLFMLIVNAFTPYVVSLICHVAIVKRLRRLRSQTQSSYEDITSPEETRSTRYSTTSMSVLSPRSRSTTGNSIASNVSKAASPDEHVYNVAMILALTYGILWFPCIFYYTLTSICVQCFPQNFYGSIYEMYVGFVVKFLIFVDAIAAPIIYCFNHSEFKKSAHKFFLKAIHSSRTDVNRVGAELPMRKRSFWWSRK